MRNLFAKNAFEDALLSRPTNGKPQKNINPNQKIRANRLPVTRAVSAANFKSVIN